MIYYMKLFIEMNTYGEITWDNWTNEISEKQPVKHYSKLKRWIEDNRGSINLQTIRRN